MKSVLLFASLLVASLSANAATFQGSTSGVFENPTGPSGMVTTGEGTNQFTWGVGATGVKYGHLFSGCFLGCAYQEDPSKLNYTGESFNTDVNNQFVAGNLNFYNGIINSGTQAESVDFLLTIDFSLPSVFSETFTYGFSLDNVVNPAGDTVTLQSSVPTKFYSYAGVDYYFELLGFSTNNSSDLIDSLFLQEGKQTTAQLIGQFTSMPSEVPLPAAVWLFGSGLMGFMAMRRRAKAQHA